ncbi:MAG: hypothetical protein ACYTDY_08645 [Planctomycetota bacterium]|jgi:hypothetical protein
MGEMTTRQKRAWWSLRGIAVQVVALGCGLAGWRVGASLGRFDPEGAGILTAIAAQVLLTPFVPAKVVREHRQVWLSPFWSILSLSVLGAALGVLYLVVRGLQRGAFMPWWTGEWVRWPSWLAILFGFIGFRLGCTFGWKGLPQK